MTDDFEFLISQYADGTLAADQAEIARAQIETDPEATAVLKKFRRINLLLADVDSMPAIDFTRLRAEISNAMDADVPAVAGRIGAGTGSGLGSVSLSSKTSWRMSWKTWSSLAAGVVICVTIGSLMRKSATAVSPGGHPQVAPAVIARVPNADPIVVAGPAEEPSTGKPVEQITVGPSPAYAARASAWQYADDGVIVHPSTVRIAAAPMARPKPH